MTGHSKKGCYLGLLVEAKLLIAVTLLLQIRLEMLCALQICIPAGARTAQPYLCRDGWLDQKQWQKVGCRQLSRALAVATFPLCILR